MADLILKGNLNLGGTLNLVGRGGKIMVGSAEALVEIDLGDPAQGTGIPVIQPPPPAGPIDPGTDVKIIKSFNATVKANEKPIVALGVCMQGGSPPKWPGMVLTSVNNQGVKVNGVPINVMHDSGITLPNGGAIAFDKASGQS